VPDPHFPFLGVHFSRRIDGNVWRTKSSPSRAKGTGCDRSPRDLMETLLYGFRRMAGSMKTGLTEMWRDAFKPAFVRALQQYLPALRSDQLVYGPSGVRAQSLDLQGNLLDDFSFGESGGVLHVRNAPSPAATASLAIGRHLAELAEQRFGLTWARRVAVPGPAETATHPPA
jgi:L-2-hydroxyglutarate oxidase LhgO